MFRSGLLCVGDCRGAWRDRPGFSRNRPRHPSTCRRFVELSGAGAVSGTNFRDGMILAIDEINAKGGILGKKIDTPLLDTQSDAGICARAGAEGARQQALRHLGPVFSGSVLIDMLLTQQAEIPQIVGGEAAAITQKGNPYVFRTSFGAAVQHAEDRQLHARRRQGQDRRRAVGEQRLRQRRPRHLHQGNERARHQGRRRHLDRSRARPISRPTWSS